MQIDTHSHIDPLAPSTANTDPLASLMSTDLTAPMLGVPLLPGTVPIQPASNARAQVGMRHHRRLQQMRMAQQCAPQTLPQQRPLHTPYPSLVGQHGARDGSSLHQTKSLQRMHSEPALSLASLNSAAFSPLQTSISDSQGGLLMSNSQPLQLPALTTSPQLKSNTLCYNLPSQLSPLTDNSTLPTAFKLKQEPLSSTQSTLQRSMSVTEQLGSLHVGSLGSLDDLLLLPSPNKAEHSPAFMSQETVSSLQFSPTQATPTTIADHDFSALLQSVNCGLPLNTLAGTNHGLSDALNGISLLSDTWSPSSETDLVSMLPDISHTSASTPGYSLLPPLGSSSLSDLQDARMGAGFPDLSTFSSDQLQILSPSSDNSKELSDYLSASMSTPGCEPQRHHSAATDSMDDMATTPTMESPQSETEPMVFDPTFALENMDFSFMPDDWDMEQHR